jgi:hypothetical protein
MVTIFHPSFVAVNFSATLASFGAGLLPAPQKDNVTVRAPYSAADADEQTAYSIRMTELEEAREAVMAAIRRADHDAAMDELAARRLADLRYEMSA